MASTRLRLAPRRRPGRPATAVLALLVAWVAACSDPGEGGRGPAADRTRAAPEPQATTVARPAEESPRSPSEPERIAMLEALRAETAHDRRVWIAAGPGNAETIALQGALAAIFEQAGWKAEKNTVTGMMLKPGISVLMADEEPPAYARTALEALQAGGLDVKSGTGYRAYYDEMKRGNPSWPGIPLAPDQSFVVVIGPEPKP